MGSSGGLLDLIQCKHNVGDLAFCLHSGLISIKQHWFYWMTKEEELGYEGKQDSSKIISIRRMSFVYFY